MTENKGSVELQKGIRFELKERMNRYLMYLQQCFICPSFIDSVGNKLDLILGNVQNKKQMQLKVCVNKNEVMMNGDMEMVGILMQDICEYMNISELEVEAIFDEELEQFCGVIKEIQELQNQEIVMNAEVN